MGEQHRKQIKLQVLITTSLCTIKVQIASGRHSASIQPTTALLVKLGVMACGISTSARNHLFAATWKIWSDCIPHLLSLVPDQGFVHFSFQDASFLEMCNP